ncbi:MAG: GYF domain-containing protein [Alphaproteobacteria bacterium]|nr:GYF domain-containing protein [Alphaproteobacteria bacterium]
MTNWHYAVQGHAQGPVPQQQLHDLVTTGRLDADTLVWTAGMLQWQKASEIAALKTPSPGLHAAAQTPPTDAGQPSAPHSSPEPTHNPSQPAAADSPGPKDRPAPATAKSTNPTLKSADWYCFYDGRTRGPIREEKLRQLLAAGSASSSSSFGADTLLWTQGMAQWQKASETQLLRPLPAPTPPSAPATTDNARPAAIRTGPEADPIADSSLKSRSGRQDSTDWYYVYNGQRKGPIGDRKLRQLLREGAFDPDTPVWTTGLPSWQKAGEIERLAPIVAPAGAINTVPEQDFATDVNLAIGAILRQSLNALRARVGIWLALGAIHTTLTLPLAMVAATLAAPGKYATLLVSLSISMLIHTIITYGASQTHSGRHFRIREAVGRGFQRFLPVMGITLLLFLAGAAGGVFFAILIGVFSLSKFNSLPLLVALAAAVCGLWFVARTYLAIPCCVVDALGPGTSVSRSFRLTKPHSGKIFGLVLIAVAPFLLVMSAVVATLVLQPAIRLLLADRTMAVAFEFVLMPFRWLPLVFISIVATTTYAHLLPSSSLPSEKIAEVFD